MHSHDISGIVERRQQTKPQVNKLAGGDNIRIGEQQPAAATQLLVKPEHKRAFFIDSDV